jgi:uncharacterized membrane protein YciS (DUF1049 family)
VQWTLFVSLVFAMTAAVVALQNPGLVELHFLVWTAQGSLAFLLLVAFACGLGAGLVIALPGQFRRRRELAAQERRIRELETRLEQMAPRPGGAPAPGPHVAVDNRDGSL